MSSDAESWRGFVGFRNRGCRLHDAAGSGHAVRNRHHIFGSIRHLEARHCTYKMISHGCWIEARTLRWDCIEVVLIFHTVRKTILVSAQCPGFQVIRVAGSSTTDGTFLKMTFQDVTTRESVFAKFTLVWPITGI